MKIHHKAFSEDYRNNDIGWCCKNRTRRIKKDIKKLLSKYRRYIDKEIILKELQDE